MNAIDFISQTNVNTLWEVITETDIFKFLSKDIQKNIYSVFINNISFFYEKEKNITNNLIEMNKKYIMIILNYIKEKYPEKVPTKIKILPEVNIKESITYEEIHNDRILDFERKLTMHEDNFKQSITVPTPPIPDFLEKNISDKPIESIELVLQEMITKRNYDIELLTSNTEKQNENNFEEKTNKIEDFVNIPKKVTWGNNEQFNFTTDETEEINTNTDIDTNTNKKLTYIEESIQLLDAKLNLILSILKK
jgi:hypothetical protein